MVLWMDGYNCESEKKWRTKNKHARNAHLNLCLHSMKMLTKILENDYVVTRHCVEKKNEVQNHQKQMT